MHCERRLPRDYRLAAQPHVTIYEVQARLSAFDQIGVRFVFKRRYSIDSFVQYLGQQLRNECATRSPEMSGKRLTRSAEREYLGRSALLAHKLHKFRVR